MKTIVTHKTPDLDAVTSVWLIKKFLPNWQDAEVEFVPAGKTLRDEIADSDPHILHVDTGFGMLDHHQANDYTCAAKKAYEYIRNQKAIFHEWSDEALERIVEVVTWYDHFRNCLLDDANADYHVFEAASIIDGFKMTHHDNDHKILELSYELLDAIYKMMQNRVWAENILEKELVPFTTQWGKAAGFETTNDEVLEVAQKSGYRVVIRKDPKKGYVRIKGTPGTGVDFTAAYEKLKQLDKEATWFLHSSKKMLLNGSTNNPDMRPTKLKLSHIINVIKQ